MTTHCHRIGRRDEEADNAADDTITLDQTDRHRRRRHYRSDHGIDFLLELPEARLLRDGDQLILEDGRRIEIRSAPEALVEVRGSNATHLLTLAWHLGNRHLLTQVRDDHLRVRADPVIIDMLRGLGAELEDIHAAFDPEGGAYAQSGHAHHSELRDTAEHQHDHGHGHDPLHGSDH